MKIWECEIWKGAAVLLSIPRGGRYKCAQLSGKLRLWKMVIALPEKLRAEQTHRIRISNIFNWSLQPTGYNEGVKTITSWCSLMGRCSVFWLDPPHLSSIRSNGLSSFFSVLVGINWEILKVAGVIASTKYVVPSTYLGVLAMYLTHVSEQRARLVLYLSGIRHGCVVSHWPVSALPFLFRASQSSSLS